MSTCPTTIVAPTRAESASCATSSRRLLRAVWRGVADFCRGFAAVAARPVGDPRTFSPRYFGERPLFLGGKAIVLRTRGRDLDELRR